MKEIVKVLLQEGIDEETIHEVLSVIEENYEIVDEASDQRLLTKQKNALAKLRNSEDDYRKFVRRGIASGQKGDPAWKKQRDEKRSRLLDLQRSASIHNDRLYARGSRRSSGKGAKGERKILNALGQFPEYTKGADSSKEQQNYHKFISSNPKAYPDNRYKYSPRKKSYSKEEKIYNKGKLPVKKGSKGRLTKKIANVADRNHHGREVFFNNDPLTPDEYANAGRIGA